MKLNDFLKVANIDEDTNIDFVVGETEYELKKFDGDHLNGEVLYNDIYIAYDYEDIDNDDLDQWYADIVTDKPFYTKDQFLELEVFSLDIQRGWVTINLFA